MLYKRAPIVEAVIDFHTAFVTPPDLPALEAFARGLRDRFPLIQNINSFELSVAADGNGGPVKSNATTEPLGFRLSTEKNDRILQVRKHGLAYSHLPPYTDWDQFLGELRPLWEGYAKVLQVTSITRVAVRYINRLQVRDGEDIDHYINIAPRVPQEVSKQIVGYFAQMVLPAAELGPEYRVIVNSGVEPNARPNTAGLLLDIDVFCERAMSVESGDAWRILDLLRGHKNKIFEASITDKVREMII